MAIALLHQLNARLRVAPAAVWEILDASSRIIFNTIGQKLDPKTEIRVGFDSAGGVLIWTRHPAGHIETWNDLADENQFAALQADSDVHIIVPVSAILVPAAKALKIAKDWPEGGQ